MNLHEILFNATEREFDFGEALNLTDVEKVILMGDMEHCLGIMIEDRENGYGLISDEVESWRTFDDVLKSVTRFIVDLET